MDFPTFREERLVRSGGTLTIRAEGPEPEVHTALDRARAAAFGLGDDVRRGIALDLVAEELEGLDAWTVRCGDTLRCGGAAAPVLAVDVLDPVNADVVLEAFDLRDGAAASCAADGDVVKVTALAPTSRAAEVLASVGLEAGPRLAAHALRHGGVVVLRDGTVQVVPAAHGL